MIGLHDIVGQPAAVDALDRMLREGRVPQALLFEGPAGVGKATCARAFGATLLCDRQGAVPCGECESCRLLDADSHPDWVRVTLGLKKTARKAVREAHEAGKEVPAEELSQFIVVDQIRQVTRLASLTPRLARRRVFLIDPADQMNTEAQNALLKTLEEPPPGSVLMLVAERGHGLLPTVRSRCFRLRFATLATTDLARILEGRGVPAAEAQERAALASGRAGRAIELDLDQLRERRDGWLDALDSLTSPGPAPADLPAMASALAGKHQPELLDGLDLLETLLRDAARVVAAPAAGSLVHADRSARLERIGQRLGAVRCASLVDTIERLRSELRVNLNRSIVAEALLASIAGGPSVR